MESHDGKEVFQIEDRPQRPSRHLTGCFVKLVMLPPQITPYAMPARRDIPITPKD